MKNCIKWIKGSGMKKFVEYFLNEKVPNYFWEIPASSTGKYHPKFASGKGGLVKHVKVAVNNALELMVLYDFSAQEEDIIIAALILHDTFKHGREGGKYSVAKHGVICADEVEIVAEAFEMPYEVRDKLTSCIASHMGQWNKDYKTKKVIAPLPKTEIQKFVHLCDYLASRKYLEVNFKEVKI